MEYGYELCDWLFAPFSVQNYASTVISAPMEVTERAQWGSGREFNGSAVYIRSSPRDRMGKPLLPNETRVISILLVCTYTGMSKVSIFRIFLIDNMLPLNSKDDFTDPLPKNSFGSVGVPLTGLLVWERHVTNVDGYEMSKLASISGHHLITCSSLTIHNMPQPGVADHRIIDRVVAGQHDFTVARILTGMRIEDRLRSSVERTSASLWVAGFKATMQRFGSELASVNRGGQCGDALVAARMACDQLGAAGIVDLMSADTSICGLPDCFERPYQIPLLLAVLTRIAAYPHRFGLWMGTAGDRFACAEIASCFEQTETPIVEAEEADESSEKHTLYAIDIVANCACATISADLESRKLVSKRKYFKALCIEEKLFTESMEALLRMGRSLCFDVAGPVTPSVYGEFGFSSRELDAASIARQERANKLGATPVSTPFIGRRLTQRTERQSTLLKTLHDVEEWLVTGRWRCIQTRTPNDAIQPDSRSGRSTGEGSERCSKHRVFRNNSGDPAWYHRINQHAFEIAHNELVKLLAQGPTHTTHSYGLFTCIYGRHSTIACSDCPAMLTPHEAFGFSSSASFCETCHRRRCLSCQLAPDVKERTNCLRCMQIKESNVWHGL